MPLLDEPFRPIARIIAILGAIVIVSAAPAAAVTPDELARLHEAGLGDEVLSALIDATGVQGEVDAQQALDLRQAGVSDRIIAQAIRRSAADTVPATVPQPGPMPAATAALVPAATDVVVVPWIVGVPVRPHPCRGCTAPTLGSYRGFGRFINTDLRPLNTDLRPLNDGFVDPARNAPPPAPPRR